MRRRGDKITHAQNLRVGVNKVNFSRRHDTTSRRQPLHGFTLVELLVVIAIIALLLSIMMPSLKRARQSAQEIVCGSNLRNIGIFSNLYAEDNRNTIIPYWFDRRTYPQYYQLTDYPHWQFVLKHLYERSNQWLAKSSRNIFACPGASPVKYRIEQNLYGGYGKNVCIDWKYEEPTVSFTIENKLLNTKNPSNIFLFMDSIYMRVTPHTVPPASWGYNYVDNRHNGGGNICFVDGHVEKRTPIPSTIHKRFKWSEWGGTGKGK